ncbi:hypothetical protein L226DRAFT_576634 [Lentinus tigrinus ALCF2SS1-7]|uniref:uncharacterized protein n=1 Tax=Lentinus tigrinus ALCF2SS1-7 TaxID=1328758 RepID=UPI001165DA3E|nr:hypothetical protein L226DRAFT_576634 [Lentinus tigrinus ALCF2SS1-7]
MDEYMHLNIQWHSTHTYVCNRLSPSGLNNSQIPLHFLASPYALADALTWLPDVYYFTAIWNAIDFNEAERQFVNAVSLNASS